MENEIDVSFVMTVYNKEYYLPSVIRALLNQTGLKNPEYIFVDAFRPISRLKLSAK